MKDWLLSQLKIERPGYNEYKINLAAKSAGEREARLQRMRINQSERLAVVSWPPSNSSLINKFNTEGYIMSCIFPLCFQPVLQDFIAP